MVTLSFAFLLLLGFHPTFEGMAAVGKIRPVIVIGLVGLE